MNHEIEIKLKQLLKKYNMIQQELCNKTGLGGRTISVLVNNKIERVPKKALSKIAYYSLRCCPKFLFNRKW